MTVQAAYAQEELVANKTILLNEPDDANRWLVKDILGKLQETLAAGNEVPTIIVGDNGVITFTFNNGTALNFGDDTQIITFHPYPLKTAIDSMMKLTR